MSIALAMEIPTAYLRLFTPLTDLDFALAHKVLEDETYATFYASRPAGRELILDNSMHELGHPISLSALTEAAIRSDATYIVPPDKLGEPEWNLRQYEACVKTISGFKLAPVLAGQTAAQRRLYLHEIRDAAMLCLPFREPRLEWFRELSQEIVESFDRIHLLGVNELNELLRWHEIAHQLRGKVVFSVDTAKPIKWAYANRSMRYMHADGVSLRGAKLSSADLLNLTSLDDMQLELVRRNTDFLRMFLG